ncbi:MAG: protein-L-isoaspartate(D-aspartate) O-methyltransferase [Acidobacteriota bacterium]
MPSELQSQYRAEMVRDQIVARGVTDPLTVAAMSKVPRDRFVAETLIDQAYGDHPLPLSSGQTISQPYIVALSTQLAEPAPGKHALDIGTGSGYQAAVLAEICQRVDSVEVVPELADRARATLRDLGYRNAFVHLTDGSKGWPAAAPYDVIVAAAAPRQIPPALIEQLAPGGRLVLPVGDIDQYLVVVEKDFSGVVRTTRHCAVRYVPMISADPAGH